MSLSCAPHSSKGFKSCRTAGLECSKIKRLKDGFATHSLWQCLTLSLNPLFSNLFKPIFYLKKKFENAKKCSKVWKCKWPGKFIQRACSYAKTIFFLHQIVASEVPRWLSWLRIWPGHCCDTALIPGPGTSTRHRHGQKRECYIKQTPANQTT